MENKHFVLIGITALVALLIILFLFQSSGKNPLEENPLNLDLNKTGQQKSPTQVPQVTELSGQELKVGTGSAVVVGDTILVHYVGSFLDGRKFDSSYDRDQPFTITIGARQVIPGFEQGVIGMKTGGKRKLLIPANLAYGPAGQGPIPPNTSIQFEVELLEIKPKETPTPSPEVTTEPSPTPTTTP